MAATSSSTGPRVSTGPASGGKRSTTRAQPGPTPGPGEAPPPLRADGEPGGDYEEGEHPRSPRHRLRERLPYWRATMHQIGIVATMHQIGMEVMYPGEVITASKLAEIDASLLR